ncbi:MAG: circadian clock KaiB family protein [bacterium]
MPKYRLYILGNNPKSRMAIDQIENILAEKYQKKYDLEIIDLLQSPQIAIRDKIFATPTLLKMKPEPVRKIIGTFKDRDKIIKLLD